MAQGQELSNRRRQTAWPHLLTPQALVMAMLPQVLVEETVLVRNRQGMPKPPR